MREGAFRASRHHERLDGPVLPWPELAALQASYVAADNPHERRALAIQFQRAINDLTEAEKASQELADLVDGPPSNWNPSTGKVWVDRQCRVLWARELHGLGYSLDAIAERMQVSIRTVRSYLRHP